MLVYLYGYERELNDGYWNIFVPQAVFTSKDKLISHINEKRKKEYNELLKIEYIWRDFERNPYIITPENIDDKLSITGCISTINTNQVYDFNGEDFSLQSVNDFALENKDKLWYPSEEELKTLNYHLQQEMDKVYVAKRNEELEEYYKLKEKYG